MSEDHINFPVEFLSLFLKLFLLEFGSQRQRRDRPSNRTPCSKLNPPEVVETALTLKITLSVSRTQRQIGLRVRIRILNTNRKLCSFPENAG